GPHAEAHVGAAGGPAEGPRRVRQAAAGLRPKERESRPAGAWAKAGAPSGRQDLGDLQELPVDVLLVLDDVLKVPEDDAPAVRADHDARLAAQQAADGVEPQARGQHAVAGGGGAAALRVPEDHAADL